MGPIQRLTGEHTLFNMLNRMLGLRLDPTLEKWLAALARQRGRTKSDLAREAIRRYLETEVLPAEARRQSLRVANARCERAATDFIERVTDLPDEP